MKQAESRKRVQELFWEHEKLITRKNVKAKSGNGVYDRYANPVLTAEHTPLFWRYDFEYESNPHLMERIGVNAAFNAGAMEYDGKYLVFARVEGVDRKSFLAVAESPNGVDNFRFWDYPIVYPLPLFAFTFFRVISFSCSRNNSCTRFLDSACFIRFSSHRLFLA
jgi:4-O-beta-D-mannosyl-D-glucose phosphorylase